MIIESILDNDFYKFTMGQLYLHQFYTADGVFKFKCRTEGVNLAKLCAFIEEQIYEMTTLKITDDEIDFLRSQQVFSGDYLSFLSDYRYNSKEVLVWQNGKTIEINVTGPLHRITYWEVPILAIVNQLYYDKIEIGNDDAAKEKLLDKLDVVRNYLPEGFLFADFGTRRRRSFEWQDYVVKYMRERTVSCVGTSNCLIAMQQNIPVIGTMAHEFLQAMQAIVHPLDSQRHALECWLKEYRGKLGIALSDVVGLDSFLWDFDADLAKAYDGVRQDSGDPVWAAEEIIAHYEACGIDPKTKRIIFSDGLDFEKMKSLHRRFKDRINVLFGIGTNLTNDGFGKQLQIVMKLIECNKRPVAKLSDSPGKEMCGDEAYVNYLRKAFRHESK